MILTILQDSDFKIHKDKAICKSSGCPLEFAKVLNVFEEIVPEIWQIGVSETDSNYIVNESLVVQEILFILEKK